jgi:hypothetical protein
MVCENGHPLRLVKHPSSPRTTQSEQFWFLTPFAFSIARHEMPNSPFGPFHAPLNHHYDDFLNSWGFLDEVIWCACNPELCRCRPPSIPIPKREPIRMRWPNPVRFPEPITRDDPIIFPNGRPIEVPDGAAEGLGIGIIIYVIISEGSRVLFPPRNFVPIW